MPDEIDIVVRDGAAVVERCPCTPCRLPSGQAGVSWRGVCYPLLDDNSIDVGSPIPTDALFAEPANRRVAVLRADDRSWVLIQGTAEACSAASRTLTARGINVLRSGRWLGDPVENRAYDWFVVCEGDVSGDAVADEAALVSPDAADALAARVAVLEQALLDTKAELSRLAASLSAADATRRPGEAMVAADPALEAALLTARHEVDALRQRLDQAAPPPPRAAARLASELQDVLSALRPDIVLLRDSTVVLSGTYATRQGAWRALRELPTSGARPDGWKALRGADRWWERHVSNGQNDTGRVYARFRTETRSWCVLFSTKAEQARDVRYLSQEIAPPP